MNGFADFHTIPWGQYSIEVTPPPEMEASPSSKTIQLPVVEPRMTVEASFDVKSGYTISGHVLNADTRQPVPGYILQLLSARPVAEVHRERLQAKSVSEPRIWHPHLISAKTDEDGYFEFPGLSPRDYKIEALMRYELYNGFIPLAPTTERTAGNNLHTSADIRLRDRNIENIIFFVLPGRVTRFTGKTVTPEGMPIENAAVSLIAPLAVKILCEPAYSNAKGEFDLSVVAPDRKEKYLCTLQAVVNNDPIELLRRVGNDFVPYTIWDSTLSAEGACNVTFKAGETVRNIQLVLKEPGSGGVLTGRILSESGMVSEFARGVELLAWQGARSWHGRVSSDGSYRIERIEPGAFRVTANPASMTRGEFGEVSAQTPPPVSFTRQTYEMIMPENERSLSFDIVLKTSSYIMGTAIDEKRMPVDGADVIALSADGNSRDRTQTNARGEFVLKGVITGVEYKLIITAVSNKPCRVQLENLMPPCNNVIAQLKISE